MIALAGIELTLEVCRGTPTTVYVVLEYRGDTFPCTGVHWIDSIVVALAQCMLVRVPDSSPGCWLTTLGPSVSSIQLEVNISQIPLDKPWMLTLPGWTLVHNAFNDGWCKAFSLYYVG